MMNTPPNSQAQALEIPLGTIVYDVEGEKVGKVTFSALHTGYFMVERGWLMTYEIYLPPTTIMTRNTDGIKLRLSKEELKQSQWKHPPSRQLTDTATPPPPAAAESAAPEADTSDQGAMRLVPPEDIGPVGGEARRLPD
jgi:hypothetical protein